MKKLLCVVLSLALILSLSLPAFAEERQVDLTFIDETVIPAPEYSFTIPDSLSLAFGVEEDLLIEVELQNLADGAYVEVFFAGTQDDEDQLCLDSADALAAGYTGYVLYSVEIDGAGPRDNLEVGETLATFTEDGQEATLSLLVSDALNDVGDIAPDTPYTGYIVFGARMITD